MLSRFITGNLSTVPTSTPIQMCLSKHILLPRFATGIPSKFVSWWEVHKLVDLTTLFELGLKPQGLALEKFLFHG